MSAEREPEDSPLPSTWNAADDPLLRALSDLPRGDLDHFRSERLRQRAHAELARTSSTTGRWLALTFERLEPVMLAACAGFTAWRVALALATLATALR